MKISIIFVSIWRICRVVPQANPNFSNYSYDSAIFKVSAYTKLEDGDTEVSTLVDIFKKFKIVLYQNESLDLNHFYQKPYQDEGYEIKEIEESFETDKFRKIRRIDIAPKNRTILDSHILRMTPDALKR